MPHKFAQIAFTDTVRQLQSQHNSRRSYARMDEGADFNFELSEREIAFIHERDSFYMASVSETGWPYVQHRGGPKGFLKSIGSNRIGFSDYRGNKQYVSTGNFRNNNRVALILMDYPNRTRLKILGRITEVSGDDWETMAKLEDESYRVSIERGFVIQVDAFDWNCPQHITPRYTQKDIEKAVEAITSENAALKLELEKLRSKLP